VVRARHQHRHRQFPRGSDGGRRADRRLLVAPPRVAVPRRARCPRVGPLRHRWDPHPGNRRPACARRPPRRRLPPSWSPAAWKRSARTSRHLPESTSPRRWPSRTSR
jgi:hypothetical protein